MLLYKQSWVLSTPFLKKFVFYYLQISRRAKASRLSNAQYAIIERNIGGVFADNWCFLCCFDVVGALAWMQAAGTYLFCRCVKLTEKIFLRHKKI